MIPIPQDVAEGTAPTAIDPSDLASVNRHDYDPVAVALFALDICQRAGELDLPRSDGYETPLIVAAALPSLLAGAQVHPPKIDTPYMTAREAAAYLRLSYSTFRKRATRIVRTPGTNRYRREDLDRYAQEYRHRCRR